MKRVLDDLNIFFSVVETGSLKKTAELLSMPHSTVSRRIDALENNLGLKLLHRSTREVKVSSRGYELYRDCAPMFGSIRQSIYHAVDAEVSFQGSLKVSMPVRAGLDFLGPWLIDFASQHSELKLDVSLSNTNLNLIQDDIDFAFRVGPLVDSSAIALHLWDIPYSVCATPSFIEKHQLTGYVSSALIESLPAVVSLPAKQWAFVTQEQEEVSLSPMAELLVDDLELALHAVMSGRYLAYLPTSMIRNQSLLEVKVDSLQPRTRSMYAYYFGRRHAQSQIKHIVSYIKERYSEIS
ncbi:LysR family transcriptional regulator [Vibrio coralliilyticus]|uniref:LysR family transcriptional regulator n=1 Tax=Vibrio coralliilyticus TaxID=190893 RepID=A0AAN0VZT8_9VIBR|nr:LysR family transcriptional regulator [Vibrio coralliilyticus]AIW20916.1 LysR family transcriptional regulator [Vibrio coralliilyticus]NOH38885.1 LysR family transcriptional regulator [Vibrio coralliilyticus]